MMIKNLKAKVKAKASQVTERIFFSIDCPYMFTEHY